MNTKFILYNFQEIQEEVELLIAHTKRGLNHDEFYSAVQHIYHHLNIAWNARNSDEGVVPDLDDPRMDEWKEFPSNIKLI